MDAEWFRSEGEALARTTAEFHRKNPLAAGIARQELRGARPAFVLDALLAGAAGIVATGDIVRLSTHKVVLREEEERARNAIEGAFEQAGLAVPDLAETLAKSGVELKRAKSILQILIRERLLVRISDELVFHHSAITALKGLLSTRRSERFGVSTFKDWTGISRKYAIPLLEYMDRERITRREGDERLVL
jgi:selenocysteine-specific elongation factor